MGQRYPFSAHVARWSGSLLLVLLACSVFAFRAHADDAAMLGEVAPDFAAKALSGQNVRLSEYRGDVVVVAFWSGRCNVCRGQLEALERITQTYRNTGLVVVSINLDANEERARDFANGLNVSYPLVVEARDAIGRDYQVNVLPTVVMIDRAGKIRFVRRDWRRLDEADYVRALRPLLDE